MTTIFKLSKNPDTGDKIFVNGVAKSGTHLLSKIVGLSGYQVNPLCVSAVQANRAAVLWEKDQESLLGSGIVIGASNPTPIHELLLRQLIRSVPVGWVFYGHCGYDVSLAALLHSEDVKHLGIIRDPRDIAVSLVRYLLQHKHPQVHNKSESELLLEVMDGIDLVSDAALQPFEKLDLGASCQAFLPWQNEHDSLVVKFEDIVGPEGGGSLSVQVEKIQQILGFVGRDPGRAEIVRDSVFGDTRTFNGGQIGSWKSVFDSEHKQKAKQLLGEYLVSTGYESDLNW